MPRKTRMTAIVLASCLALAWVFMPNTAAQNEAGDEVRAALEAYMQAFKDKDVAAAVAVFADDAVLLGTGPGERWVGTEEITEAHEVMLNSYDKETSNRTWAKWDINGDVAWGTSQTEVVNYYKNEKNEFFLNISAVVEKQSDGWTIVSLHVSNVTGS